ncbi:RNA-binding domain-containing protein [Allorhodopirellula heiligendammensis]|uniref:Divergent AAA domain protein n=1 Tax=Allorhodopirellula heiligendammensis TaxID=2714739 RepID=A0A5C6B5H2_9BACT|nr:RNA-binding domain-containing protein [Allorhodopirellula heiligendammensis]TWU06549.1 Divergent AAA domain protein [Allorhodopirellula heiligendammensis]
MPRALGELESILHGLIDNWENEVVEFKAVGDSYSTSDIGKYVSALSNEANLRCVDTAWLVFGVDNKTREVVDSSYRRDQERLHSLKKQVADGSSPSLTFREIHEIVVDGARVLMLEIPPAPRGVPISWNGHFYARANESLAALTDDKRDEIRNQTLTQDWTAAIVPDAERRHLSNEAVEKAKANFSIRHKSIFTADEVKHWDEATFLDRAGLTVDGQITRTALLLVGETTSTHLLSPYLAQIVWKLVGPEQGNQIFTPPYLLATTALYNKIRNVQIRILPSDSLIAVEVSKYDQGIVLESLHNCIAHQDYRLGSRIVVTESPDRLVLENSGTFFEGHPDDYVMGHKTPRSYRNPFLMQAMTRLNMIDTLGYGIHRMYVGQAERFFPLPDYDVSEPGTVRLTIHGAIVDPDYSRALIQRTELSLVDIRLLDRVQKRLPIDKTAVQRLRRQGLVEGRQPNLVVSPQIAATTDRKAEYIRTRAQDDTHYQRLILDFIQQFGSATRVDLDKMLIPHLPALLSEDQRRNKVRNYLQSLRRNSDIHRRYENGGSRWFIGPEASSLEQKGVGSESDETC